MIWADLSLLLAIFSAESLPQAQTFRSYPGKIPTTFWTFSAVMLEKLFFPHLCWKGQETYCRHFIERHGSGDWGEVCAADKAANDQAVVSGGRILSAYKLPDGQKIWIISEHDRSATTILRPDEY